MGQILKVDQPKSIQIKGGSTFLCVFPELLKHWFPKVVLLAHGNFKEHSEEDQKQMIYKQFLLWPRHHYWADPFLQAHPQPCKSEIYWVATNSTVSPCSPEKDFSITVSTQWDVCSLFFLDIPSFSSCAVSPSLSHLHTTRNLLLCVFRSFQERNNFSKPPQAALDLV